MKLQNTLASGATCAAIAAATFALSGTSASAAVLSFAPGKGAAVNFGDGNYNGTPCPGDITKCYNPSGAVAAGLTEDLLVFDDSAANMRGPGLVLDEAAIITVTFLGKEAGAQNYAFSLGGEVANTDVIGASYSVAVDAGTLDFSFKSLFGGGTLASNDGTFIGTAAMGFSKLYNGGTKVYAFFDDSGAADDRDFDDMVVEITISQVPVPAAGFLLIAGLGGLAALKRRKKA